MAPILRGKEVERLAEELARRTGESKAGAIRKALEHGEDPLYRFLEEVWPHTPPEPRGQGMSRMDEIWGG